MSRRIVYWAWIIMTKDEICTRRFSELIQTARCTLQPYKLYWPCSSINYIMHSKDLKKNKNRSKRNLAVAQSKWYVRTNLYYIVCRQRDSGVSGSEHYYLNYIIDRVLTVRLNSVQPKLLYWSIYRENN